MSAMASPLTGVIHGRTVELNQATGLPDGQAVKVTLEPVAVSAEELLPPGEGLRRAFGAWEEDGEELEAFLREIRHCRKRTRPEIEP